MSGITTDSLGPRRIGDIAFSIASRTTPTPVLVNEDAIITARYQLWRDYRIAAEYGAAAAFAALTSSAHQPTPNERVAVVICGANTDVRTLEPEARQLCRATCNTSTAPLPESHMPFGQRH